MHHKDTYLCLKQTPIPHLCPAGNTRAPVCVCVPPGGPPGGNTRHTGVHCVLSCFCSLLVLGPEIFQAKSPIHLCRKKNEKKRERKELDTQCTPLCLVFPPGALPGGHTHRSYGIPCGAQMRDCSLFQANISVLVMHVVRDSQPLFLLLCSRILSLQNFFQQILKFTPCLSFIRAFFLEAERKIANKQKTSFWFIFSPRQ